MELRRVGGVIHAVADALLPPPYSTDLCCSAHALTMRESGVNLVDLAQLLEAVEEMVEGVQGPHLKRRRTQPPKPPSACMAAALAAPAAVGSEGGEKEEEGARAMEVEMTEEAPPPQAPCLHLQRAASFSMRGRERFVSAKVAAGLMVGEDEGEEEEEPCLVRRKRPTKRGGSASGTKAGHVTKKSAPKKARATAAVAAAVAGAATSMRVRPRKAARPLPLPLF
jgi:hypothetical protein